MLRQSEKLQWWLREADVNVEWVPLESFIDDYGGAHCMTQVLKCETYHKLETAVKKVKKAKKKR